VDRRFCLKRSTDFQRVRKHGKSFAHPLFVLIFLPNGSDSTRIGVAAGRSLGNAVKRNRAKRRLKACIRTWISQLNTGFDIILLARKPLLTAEFDLLQAAMGYVLHQTNLAMKHENKT
jgi:ribonuclease P protein component